MLTFITLTSLLSSAGTGFDKQTWVDFTMAASLDTLQESHVYLPQTDPFCLYKELTGILECCHLYRDC